MIRHAILPALAAIGLSACETLEPLDRSVLTRGTEPAYTFRADGAITPTSCLRDRGAGQGAVPPGCVLDGAFGQQAAVQSHLVHPSRPGAAYAAPAARAAYDYIYGDGASDGSTGAESRREQGAERIDVEGAPAVEEAPIDGGEAAATPASCEVIRGDGSGTMPPGCI